MRSRLNWTREELYLALNLYCKIPFGRISHRNTKIKALAEYLGRTPGALAMKMVNFASLDTSLMQKGLTSCSKLDRDVWNDFFKKPATVLESEDILSAVISTDNDEPLVSDYSVEDYISSVKTRKLQTFFRKTILASYGFKCCITGIAHSELLVASHIIPWKTDKDNRLNPHNGLCLNALHDKAFDRGLVTIDSNMNVVVSPLIPKDHAHSFLWDYAGETIAMPKRFYPDQSFLKFHREKIFRQ